MNVEEFLYRIGESVDSGTRRIIESVKGFLHPSPLLRASALQVPQKAHQKAPHRPRVPKPQAPADLPRLPLAQPCPALLEAQPLWLAGGLAAIYFLYLRYTLTRNREFFIEFQPYRFFYYSISTISFGAFLGYDLLRRIATSVYYYYTYLTLVVVAILAFRWYFKAKYGRDYTYGGVVEELRGGGLARVSVHDDIAANVKPGYYWVDAVDDLEVGGRVVKLLIEDRKLRGGRFRRGYSRFTSGGSVLPELDRAEGGEREQEQQVKGRARLPTVGLCKALPVFDYEGSTLGGEHLTIISPSRSPYSRFSPPRQTLSMNRNALPGSLSSK